MSKLCLFARGSICGNIPVRQESVQVGVPNIHHTLVQTPPSPNDICKEPFVQQGNLVSLQRNISSQKNENFQKYSDEHVPGKQPSSYSPISKYHSSQTSENHTTNQLTNHKNFFIQRYADNSLCKLCRDNPAGIVFMPCGHLISCESCAISLLKCTVCKRNIERLSHVDDIGGARSNRDTVNDVSGICLGNGNQSLKYPPQKKAVNTPVQSLLFSSLYSSDSNYNYNNSSNIIGHQENQIQQRVSVELNSRYNYSDPRQHIHQQPPQSTVMNNSVGGRRVSQGSFDNVRCNSNGLSKYSDESKRFKTFFTWPRDAEAQPAALVKAGFFYTEKNDIVQCCMCGLIKGAWRSIDDPLQVHLASRENCPFLKKSHPHLFSHYSNNNIKSHLQHSSRTDWSQNPTNMAYQQHKTHDTSPFMTQHLVHGNQPTVKNLYLVNSIGSGGRKPQFQQQQNKTSDIHYPSSRQPTQQYIYRKQHPQQQNYHQQQQYPHQQYRPLGEQRFQQIPLASHPSPPLIHNINSFYPTTPKTHINTEKDQQPTTGSKTQYNCFDDSQFGTRLDEKEPYVDSTNNETLATTYPRNAKEIRQLHRLNQERARHAYELEQLNCGEAYNNNNNLNCLCKICEDNPVAITFVPCGHLVVCESCALGLLMCPVCRKGINKTQRTFFDGN